MKLPAFQFYPGDWRKDPGIQALGYLERGIWMEMLCLMHECEPRGHLMLNGAPMNEDVIARMLGLDKQILTTTLSTLLSFGVAKKDPATGAIYSSRMVRDEAMRKIKQNAGKQGGNPRLLKQNQTTGVKQNPTTGVKQNPTSSYSSSSSTSVDKEGSLSPAVAEPDPNTWETKQSIQPRPPMPENVHQRSEAIHGWYCEQMGAAIPFDMRVDRLWAEWFREFTEDQFKRVFRYLKKQVDMKKRNDGALKLSNMLQPEKFHEDLAVAVRGSVKPLPNHSPSIQEPTRPRSPEDWEKGAEAIRALKEQLAKNEVPA